MTDVTHLFDPNQPNRPERGEEGVAFCGTVAVRRLGHTTTDIESLPGRCPDCVAAASTDETSWAQVWANTDAVPDREQLDALYVRYAAEGHLITQTCLNDDDPDAETWVSKCSCGDCSGFGPDGPEGDAPLRLLSFIDARWWARGHRAMEGLPWQDWIKRVNPAEFFAPVYMGEGHCVTALPLDAETWAADPDIYVGEWQAFCSCALDLLDLDPDMGPAALRSLGKAGTYNEVDDWHVEHRAGYGLPPQVGLPLPGESFTFEDDDAEARR